MAVSKSQLIRVLDVVLIGPGMYWTAAVARKHVKGDLAKAAAGAMMITGILTIAYNGWNWLKGEEIKGAIARDGFALVEFEKSSFKVEPIAPFEKTQAP